MELREYQKNALDYLLSDTEDRLMVLPTGAGKTVIFTEFIKHLKDKQILVMVHRDFLVSQICEYLNINPYKGSNRVVESNIVVTNPIIVKNDIDKLPKFDVIIIDEAHHCYSKTYTHVLNKFKDSRKIGFTATPFRLDGGKLSSIWAEFKQIITIKQLLKDNYLETPKVLIPKKSFDTKNMKITAGDYQKNDQSKFLMHNKLYGSFKEQLDKLNVTSKDRVLVYCPTIKDCEELQKEIGGELLTGKVKGRDRDNLLHNFETGVFNILISVEVVTEGFDLPLVSIIGLLRPTISKSLYIQMVGRALRIHKDKHRCIILDMVANSPIHAKFGIEDIDCDFTELWEYKGEKRVKSDSPTLCVCKKCLFVTDKFFTVCPKCGAERETFGRKYIKISEDNFIEFKGYKLNSYEFDRAYLKLAEKDAIDEHTDDLIGNCMILDDQGKSYQNAYAETMGTVVDPCVVKQLRILAKYHHGWDKHFIKRLLHIKALDKVKKG